ncbi:hypothetical protein L218DRAFT_974492 [Marasmius fiardii PR-910]|nr:hypothetical protein L218DRAFT_974492 [Marasmius fiardii PR-910]
MRLKSYSYCHNSQARFPQPKCSEGTREEILKDLLQWICSSSSQDVPGVCWLWGLAGAGKSAIAQTIAERCEGKELLVSFFFSRTDPNRNTPKYLALAIADALITAHPTLQDIILQVIHDRPGILHMTLEAQFRALVVEPLLKCSETLTIPSLVIIDGLDECISPLGQKEVLSLALLAMEQGLPISFLICSRPEPQIQEEFTGEGLDQFTESISLNDDQNVNQDIRAVFCEGFDKIRNSSRCKHMDFPDPWPTWDELGQFAYPATIIKFTKDL